QSLSACAGPRVATRGFPVPPDRCPTGSFHYRTPTPASIVRVRAPPGCAASVALESPSRFGGSVMLRLFSAGLHSFPRRSARLFPLAPLPLPPPLAAARADDWPQWLGPRRDGVWRETGLLQKFPPGGPTIRWRAPVGQGYAGPAVANGRVYVTDLVLAP